MRILVLSCALLASCRSGSSRGELIARGPLASVAGTAIDLALTAGKSGFSGAIHLASSDPAAVLPADPVLKLAAAQSLVVQVTLKTAGAQTVRAEDPANGRLIASTEVAVAAAQASQLRLKPARPWTCPPFDLEVSIVDPFGNVDPGALATLHVQGGPPDYALTPGDRGQHVFHLGESAADARTVFASSSDGFSAAIDLVPHGWCGIGPRQVVNLAVVPAAPQTAYAATPGGIFRSTDGGRTWGSVNDGIVNGRSTFAVAAATGSPPDAYAATSSGLYVLRNGGALWLETSPIRVSATAVAIDPQHPATIFAGSGGGPNGIGIARSTDAGATWTLVNAGLAPEVGVGAIAIDPASSAVYAGIGRGVTRSDNAGASWTPAGGPGGGFIEYVDSLAVAPTGVLYAGSSGDALYRSRDGGATWSAPLGPLNPTGIAIDGSAVYVATPSAGYRSVDEGATWTTVTTFPVTALVPGGGGALWAGTPGDGVRTSSDGGNSWLAPDQDVQAAFVFSLGWDPAARMIYAGARGGGVLTSRDRGRTWAFAQVSGSLTDIEAIAVDPVTPSTVYVSDFKVAKSVDSGAHWADASTGIQGMVRALAIDPAAPSTLYAGLQDGLYKSVDAAASWTPAGFAGTWVSAIAFDPADPARVYANTSQGFFRSPDRGATWTPASAGPPAVLDPHPIVVAPDSTLYVGGNRGVYRSTDGGVTFSLITPDSAAFYTLSMALDSARGTLFVGGSDAVRKTTDGGKTWLVAGEGFPRTPQIRALLIEPGAQFPMLYAGTYGMGVYKSWGGE